MNSEVVLLDGVEAFLDTLPVKLQAKAYWTMRLLQQMGSKLREPHCKPVKGFAGLHELRITFASDTVRLFYFEHNQKQYVVTSGYVKKEQKLKRQEIEKAYRLMLRFLQEKPDDQIE